MKTARRLGLIAAVLALAAAGLYCYARYVEPSRLAIETLRIDDAGLPAPVRLVAFSDVHLGSGGVDSGRLARLADEINALHPDAVLFLGDLYDNYEEYGGDTGADAAALASIDAPVKLAVWGNHDMGGGAHRVYPDVLRQGGFTLLENESVPVPELGICFGGVADMTFGFPDDSGLWTGDLYRVLLSHEPDYALEVTDVPLQLSGHSHGGQVYLPLVGAPLVPAGARSFLRGACEKDDGGIVYVSRGIGMSVLPLRFGSVPELTVIEIQ